MGFFGFMARVRLVFSTTGNLARTSVNLTGVGIWAWKGWITRQTNNNGAAERHAKYKRGAMIHEMIHIVGGLAK